MNFHNELIRLHPTYNILFDSSDYHNTLEIQVNDTIYIRALYTIIGTYNSKKNLWIWADQSKSISLKDISMSSELRKKSTDELIRNFVKQNMGIYSTSDIHNNLVKFEKEIGKDIVLNKVRNSIQYYAIERILIDNR